MAWASSRKYTVPDHLSIGTAPSEIESVMNLYISVNTSNKYLNVAHDSSSRLIRQLTLGKSDKPHHSYM